MPHGSRDRQAELWTSSSHGELFGVTSPKDIGNRSAVSALNILRKLEDLTGMRSERYANEPEAVPI
jgi:hypothetical protein